MKKPKLVRIDLDEPIAGLVKKSDYKVLGLWAVEIAERTLHHFEEKYPKDDRPRKAIVVLREWIENGTFKMSDIRGASLAAHAAAREVRDDDYAARAGARCCGQAVATAHVPRHALGAAVYAATAVRDASGSDEEAKKKETGNISVCWI